MAPAGGPDVELQGGVGLAGQGFNDMESVDPTAAQSVPYKRTERPQQSMHLALIAFIGSNLKPRSSQASLEKPRGSRPLVSSSVFCFSGVALDVFVIFIFRDWMLLLPRSPSQPTVRHDEAPRDPRSEVAVDIEKSV